MKLGNHLISNNRRIVRRFFSSILRVPDSKVLDFFDLSALSVGWWLLHWLYSPRPGRIEPAAMRPFSAPGDDVLQGVVHG